MNIELRLFRDGEATKGDFPTIMNTQPSPSNPSIKEEERNFDIDVLFAWITKRIDYDELSEEMTNCVKSHEFEEAAIARDKRDEISKVLTDLRVTVFELIEKYQYYTQSAKGLLSIQPDK